MTKDERSAIRQQMSVVSERFKQRRAEGAPWSELEVLFQQHSDLFEFIMRDFGEDGIVDSMNGLVEAVRGIGREA